jgi:hypothetical protein
MKQCTECLGLLEFSNFYFKQKVSKKTGDEYIWYDTHCKTCRKNKVASNPSRNPNVRNKYLKEWRDKNKDKLYLQNRQSYLHRAYNLTVEQYNNLRHTQNYCCSICNKHEVELQTNVGKTNDQALYVDHDHVTGKVRALLCLNCNTLLGRCNDDKDILAKAILYLERYSNAE